MKKLYYPKFKVEINDKKIVDFEDTYGDGRFITSFVEENDMELEGIKAANKWKKQMNEENKEWTPDIQILEMKLLDYIRMNCKENVSNVQIKEIDYYYSDKIYCYNCKSWFYEDDSCDC